MSARTERIQKTLDELLQNGTRPRDVPDWFSTEDLETIAVLYARQRKAAINAKKETADPPHEAPMRNYCDCGDYCAWCHPELCGGITC